jgi:integrase
LATATRSSSKSSSRSPKPSFRVGRVKGYLRGSVWYLSYHEGGERLRPRVGPDVATAKRLAAETNARMYGAAVPKADVVSPQPPPTAPPSLAPSLEQIKLEELRSRWLDFHEHVRRSAVQTIARYRAATDHLLRFVRVTGVTLDVANFTSAQAEAFVRYLRIVEITPNGHRSTAKRRLRDKGVWFILAASRSLFVFAAKRKHLPPYAENPFAMLEIGRMPIEDAKPVILLTGAQEKLFLEACDDWQFPLFATLMFTGLRPGELSHLLLPGDLDLGRRILRIMNKPKLGWQVKTRGEREVPLHPLLAAMLAKLVGRRNDGAVFQQRRCGNGYQPPLRGITIDDLEVEQERRVAAAAAKLGRGLNRCERLHVSRGVWRDLAAVAEDRIRLEFMSLTKGIGLTQLTMPKVLRHGFATCLQEGNVDPLIRNQLMGHAPGEGRAGGGLGMTAVYTHSRPVTIRSQLEAALKGTAVETAVASWLQRAGSTP